MAGTWTIGELCKAKVIPEADLDAAVEAYMADPTTLRFAIGDRYTANLFAAVAESPFAARMIADPGIKPGSKRSVVGTAILLSKPLKE